MAVSLAHISQEAPRPRATTLPSNLPPPPPIYDLPRMAFHPTLQSQPHAAGPQHAQQRFSTVPSYPAANQPWVGIPLAPMSYPPEQRYAYQPGLEFSFPPTQQQDWQNPYPPPIGLDCSERPPTLPPRPIEQQQSASPHDSAHSSNSCSSSPTRPSIEPDPLPPHSNPQALSATQSAAFHASQRIPDLRLGDDEIYDTTTGLAAFRISRPARRSILPTKVQLTLTSTTDGHVVGSLRFPLYHASSTIELELQSSSRRTAITHSGMLHDRWAFTSTNTGERWYWRATETGGAVLTTAKHGHHGEVVARVEERTRLSFLRPRVSDAEYAEIVLSAVGILEAAGRGKRGKGGRRDGGDLVGER